MNRFTPYTFRFFGQLRSEDQTCQPLINRIMIGSYIRTSVRNVMRNKLFSFINIVGLAISMSVGLLLIAFVFDLRSYDRFHENGERIYRVTSTLTARREQGRATNGTVCHHLHKDRKAYPPESDRR